MMQLLAFVIFSWHVIADKDSMLMGLNRMKQDGIVIDVGANGGKETSLALSQGRKVVALECLSDAYVKLRSRFKHKQNVTLLNLCAGATHELKTLHLADDSSSLIKSNVKAPAEAMKANRPHNKLRNQRETVVVVKLDDLIHEQVALIKIDAQGYDGLVLRGASRLINSYHPVLIYEENVGLQNSPVSLPHEYHCVPSREDRVCYVP
jgi:FkbM family methyltransferase